MGSKWRALPSDSNRLTLAGCLGCKFESEVLLGNATRTRHTDPKHVGFISEAMCELCSPPPRSAAPLMPKPVPCALYPEAA